MGSDAGRGHVRASAVQQQVCNAGPAARAQLPFGLLRSAIAPARPPAPSGRPSTAGANAAAAAARATHLICSLIAASALEPKLMRANDSTCSLALSTTASSLWTCMAQICMACMCKVCKCCVWCALGGLSTCACERTCVGRTRSLPGSNRRVHGRDGTRVRLRVRVHRARCAARAMQSARYWPHAHADCRGGCSGRCEHAERCSDARVAPRRGARMWRRRLRSSEHGQLPHVLSTR